MNLKLHVYYNKYLVIPKIYKSTPYNSKLILLHPLNKNPESTIGYTNTWFIFFQEVCKNKKNLVLLFFFLNRMSEKLFICLFLFLYIQLNQDGFFYFPFFLNKHPFLLLPPPSPSFPSFQMVDTSTLERKKRKNENIHYTIK